MRLRQRLYNARFCSNREGRHVFFFFFGYAFRRLFSWRLPTFCYCFRASNMPDAVCTTLIAAWVAESLSSHEIAIRYTSAEFLQEGGSCFRQCREISLLSGPINAVWVSSGGDRSSTLPQIAVTCGADRLIKVRYLSLLCRTFASQTSPVCFLQHICYSFGSRRLGTKLDALLANVCGVLVVSLSGLESGKRKRY